MKTVLQHIGAYARHTPTYYPAANGLVERVHKDLKTMLRCRIGNAKSEWIHALPWVLLGLRNTPMRDIGASRAELVYGVPLIVPGEVLHDDTAPQSHILRHVCYMTANRVNTPTSQHGQAAVYIPKDLATAHHVWLRVDKVWDGLTPLYVGPYKVLEHTEHTKLLDMGLDELGRSHSEWHDVGRIKVTPYDEDGAVPEPPVRPVRGRKPEVPQAPVAPPDRTQRYSIPPQQPTTSETPCPESETTRAGRPIDCHNTCKTTDWAVNDPAQGRAVQGYFFSRIFGSLFLL